MGEGNPERSTRAAKERIEQARGEPVTGRDWSTYLERFDLQGREKDFWRGKTILDVGSGRKKDDPEKSFPGAKVCAIDPEFLAPGEVPPQHKKSPEQGRILENTAHEKRVGVAQEIPYDDDKFDLVLSSHAIAYVPLADMPRVVLEMLRVMKSTGEVRLFPCIERDIKPELRKALEESGFKIDTPQDVLTILRAGEEVKGDVDKKREAWKKLNRCLFPAEELTSD